MRIVLCALNKEMLSNFETMIANPWVHHVGSATCAEELVMRVNDNKVDVIVMGQFFTDEFKRARTLLEAKGIPVPKSAVVSFQVSGALCLHCWEDGVDDLIDLREGFEAMAERLLLLSTGFSATSGTEVVPARWSSRCDHFNDAIHDVLDAKIMIRLLAGETNSEISQSVHLSCQTVNNRISQMIHRTGTENRTRLASLFHQASSPTEHLQASLAAH